MGLLSAGPAEPGLLRTAPGEGFGLALLFAAIPLLVGVWYHGQDSAEPSQSWELDQPVGSAWRIGEIKPTGSQQAMLQFSSWKGLVVELPEGFKARLIHLVWEKDRRMPPMAFSHTPALCMPSLGWELVGKPASLSMVFAGQRLEFRRYSFCQGEDWMTVYQHLRRDTDEGPFTVSTEDSRWARLATLWQAPARQVKEELLVYVSATVDDSEAVLSRLLGVLLRRYNPEGLRQEQGNNQR